MEGQLSLFDLNNETYVDKIQNILDVISAERDLPAGCLNIKKQDNINDGEYLIEIFEPEYPAINDAGVKKGVISSLLILKEAHLKTETRYNIIIQEKFFNMIAEPDNATIKRTKSSDYVTVTYNEPNDSYLDYINSVINLRVRTYKSKESFGCCSKFNACSDAKKCLHENVLYATGCKYRQSLDEGKIFYGKNRNVD